MMEEAVAVKEEDPEETSPPDPFQVPPSVVLEKLGQLLTSGRALLRYSLTGGEGSWGLNGKVADRWCSFSTEVDGVCRFEDESAFVTESAEVWASRELEKLKLLAREALQLPSTNAPQPGAHRSRDCRRAVFDFHRAEHIKRRRERVMKRRQLQGLQRSPAKCAAKIPPAKNPAAMTTEMLPPAKAVTAANSGAPLAAKAAVVIRKAPSAKAAGVGGRAPLAKLAATATEDGSSPAPPAPPMPKLDIKPAATSSAPSVRSWNDVAHHVTPAASGVPPSDQTTETEPRMSAILGGEPVERQHTDTVASFLPMPKPDVSMPFRLVVYFMRGPPGCGKSTAARHILAQHLSAQGIKLTPQASQAAFLPIYRAFIHSTDDFFTKFKETGDAEYQFDPAFLQENHARNRVRTEAAMRLCLTPLIIDNTNIALWEMRDYIRLADQFHYEVRIIDPQTLDSEGLNPDVLFARCQQATPDRPRGKKIGHHVLKRMNQNFEPLPGGEAGLEAVRTAKRRRRELEKPTVHVEDVQVAADILRDIANEEMPSPAAPQAMEATAQDAPTNQTIENDTSADSAPPRPPAKVPITKKPSVLAKPPQKEAGQLILTTKAAGSKALPALKMPMAKKSPSANPPTQLILQAAAAKALTANAKNSPGRESKLQLAIERVAKALKKPLALVARAAAGAPGNDKAVPEPEVARVPEALPKAEAAEVAAPAKAGTPPQTAAAPKVEGVPKAVDEPKATAKITKAVAKVVATAASQRAGAVKAREAKAFLEMAKNCLVKAKQKKKYKQLLRAISGNAGKAGVVKVLDGHSDLVGSYLRWAASMDQPINKASVETTAVPMPPSTLQARVAPVSSPLAKAPLLPSARSQEASVVLRRTTLAVPASAVLASVQAVSDPFLQFSKLVLAKMEARAGLRLAMVRYAKSRPAQDGAFREMILIRGPHGLGKSNWAMEQLCQQIDIPASDKLAARLSHICSVDDFFTTFDAMGKEHISFDLAQVERAHAFNEARVQLAMKAGIHPIFVDAVHTQLWEMEPYARLAKEMGYEVSVVPPEGVAGDDWKDVEALAMRNALRQPPRRISREQLTALVDAHELLEVPDGDVLGPLIAARRGTEGRLVATPAAILTSGVKRPAPPAMPPPLASRSAVAPSSDSQALRKVIRIAEGESALLKAMRESLVAPVEIDGEEEDEAT